MTRGTSLRPWLGRVVLVLWFASAITLAFRQWREAGQPHHFGPEIPEESRQAAAAVLEGCQRRVGAEDMLAIAFSMSEGHHQFLSFRLAYTLYPVRVINEAYGDGDDIEQAVAKLRMRHPDFILVLGREDVTPADATLVAALAPEARLYRLTAREH